MDLFKKPKMIILIVLILVAGFFLATRGLEYGLDFNGGTEFVITLDDEVEDPGTMSRITSTISQRLDWSGLADVKVTSWENRFISAQVATTDPDEIAELEELLQKQGKFENMMAGEVIFTGDDILSVPKDPQKGYGVKSDGTWVMPFVLSQSAAEIFASESFHKCVPNLQGGYDCPSTYFFIDRPSDALILVPSEVYLEEEFMFSDPLNMRGSEISADTLFNEANLNYIVTDEADKETRDKIISLKENGEISRVIYPEGYSYDGLEDIEITVEEFAKTEKYPWIWSVSGLRSIISLTDSITNEDAATKDSASYNVFRNLVITGVGSDKEDAQERLDNLYILLSAGSLPIGVDGISKEVVSADYGSSFLSSIILMGIIAIILVALVIFVRYKNPKLVIPILVTTFSEVLIILGFASFIRWNLDLAALAGILAAVGTGVDDQIIITDELSKDKKDTHESSLLSKVARAFFIIFATAATTFATMFPIILFGFGLGKLVGFAITTIAGVVIGVLVTRPAFAEMVKYILSEN